MKRRLLPGIIVTVLLVACGRMPAYQIRTLPSGKALKVMGVGQVNFPNVGPALMLRYLTDVNADDRAALRREADQIWVAFRPDVEKAGQVSAVLSANSIQPGFIFPSGQSDFFVFKQDSSGNWKCLTAP